MKYQTQVTSSSICSSNFHLLDGTMNQPNKDRHDNNPPQPSIEQDDLCKELESATGGSAFSVLFDIATGLIPAKHVYKAVSGQYADEEKLMEKTGQTSIGDQIKWKVLPSTMNEKTQKGLEQARDSVLMEYALENHQFNKNMGN